MMLSKRDHQMAARAFSVNRVMREKRFQLFIVYAYSTCLYIYIYIKRERDRERIKIECTDNVWYTNGIQNVSDCGRGIDKIDARKVESESEIQVTRDSRFERLIS